MTDFRPVLAIGAADTLFKGEGTTPSYLAAHTVEAFQWYGRGLDVRVVVVARSIEQDALEAALMSAGIKNVEAFGGTSADHVRQALVRVGATAMFSANPKDLQSASEADELLFAGRGRGIVACGIGDTAIADLSHMRFHAAKLEVEDLEYLSEEVLRHRVVLSLSKINSATGYLAEGAVALESPRFTIGVDMNGTLVNGAGVLEQGAENFLRAVHDLGGQAVVMSSYPEAHVRRLLEDAGVAVPEGNFGPYYPGLRVDDIRSGDKRKALEESGAIALVADGVIDMRDAERAGVAGVSVDNSAADYAFRGLYAVTEALPTIVEQELAKQETRSAPALTQAPSAIRTTDPVAPMPGVHQEPAVNLARDPAHRPRPDAKL